MFSFLHRHRNYYNETILTEINSKNGKITVDFMRPLRYNKDSKTNKNSSLGDDLPSEGVLS